MNDLAERIANLSGDKRALLLSRLKKEPAPDASSSRIVPRPRSGELPLSFAQERLWFLSRLEPDSGFYNVPAALRLIGRLNLSALERAFTEVIRRHEVLRTRFVTTAGQPHQAIVPDIDFKIPRTDLRGWPEAWVETEIRHRAEQEAERPFDLSEGPLIRANLLYLGQREREDEHVLLITVHHIVFDGWSIGILIGELADVYAAFSAGRPSSLPELAIQYADYALWQREHLQGERLERHLAYWRQQLEGAPPLLELPTDRPRPANPSYRGAVCAFEIPASLSRALYVLSLKEGATLFMTLSAAFKLLLSRYSGQKDICVGTPVANRTRAELEGLIGFFINMLVLRTNLAGNPSFIELLARERQVCLGAQMHQDLPFEKLVEALQPERHSSYSPLFQVMFVVQNAPTRKLDVAGLRIGELPVENRIAKFDLALDVVETATGLNASFEYVTDLFDRETVERMASGFLTLLEGIVAHPEARLSELPLLSGAERRRLLEEWNSTDREYPKNLHLHRLFELRAGKTPDAVAVVCDGRRFSYRELNQRANRLGHYLQELGVGPEVRVGLCLERGWEAVVGILGILKAGGAYVPLDPHYPRERIADALADCGAPVLVSTVDLAERLSGGAKLVCLDRDETGIAERSADNLPPPGSEEQAAYLIYTSGSTGKPKGVVISHRNAMASTCARFHAYPEPVAGFLLLPSFAFDSSVAGLFWTLSQGGTLCIPREEDHRDPAALARLIAAEGLTHLLCLPALYGLILEQAGSGRLDSLRAAIVAGEACPPALVAKHCERLPGTRLYNEYGPTEGTVWCAVHDVRAADAVSGQSIAIGQPIENARIYLLDTDSNPSPVGVPGELYIGGAGVARGYHQRPELTAERFVPDPFAAEPGNRMYRTGDLARWRPDGTLEFLGRVDHQVKIRGFRIELGEIEARLFDHPEVKEAAVIVREDAPGNRRLVAYVAGTRKAAFAADELRAFLAESLPDYMVPSAFVALEQFPLTASGKPDRNALPAPEAAQAADDRYVAPRTPTEEALAGIWAELFRLERVGIHDNFFELGGHSLLTFQVILKIQEIFGIELQVTALFDAPTVADLAPRIAERQMDGRNGGARVMPSDIGGTPDLEAEAELDPSIRPASVWTPDVFDPKNIFLTGPTGFLGSFLLHEAIKRTRAKVHCLVRAADSADAAAKIRRVLERYELWDSAMAERIEPVCGDLSEPDFGLEQARYRRLAAEIDVIYHNGAWVNAVHPYRILAPANVFGTREVLRLACACKVKPLHYISTTSVFGDNPSPSPEGFSEDEFPAPDSNIGTGYAQTKWVAERMVRIAGERGLPVAIYRPSFITGHSGSGVWNTDDLLCRVMKCCIEMGYAPDLEDILDVVPVDYVGKAVMRLPSRADSFGRCFHLTNPVPVFVDDLVSRVVDFGFDIRTVPLDVWLKELRAMVGSNPHHPMFSLVGLFENIAAHGDDRAQRFDCRKTAAVLAGEGLVCPPPDDRLWRLYLGYFVRSGFLEMQSA